MAKDFEKTLHDRQSTAKPTAAWALLSFVGVFKPKPSRSVDHEQNQNSETGVIPPRSNYLKLSKTAGFRCG